MSATSPAADLRLELRARNNVLWHVIYDAAPSVVEFCRRHGVHASRVCDLLNLKASPYNRHGAPVPLAEKLAEIARMLVDDLFPPDLYGLDLGRRLVAEVPSCNMRSLAAARTLALPPAQEDEIVRGELQAAFDEVLKTLTPREERVMRLRFGFDDHDEHTYRQIGERFGLTHERVRQIEASALRKLRHPARSRKVRRIVDGWSPYIDVDVKASPVVEPEVVEPEAPAVAPKAPEVIGYVLPCGCRAVPYLRDVGTGGIVWVWVLVLPEHNRHVRGRRVLCITPDDLLPLTEGAVWPEVDPHDHVPDDLQR